LFKKQKYLVTWGGKVNRYPDLSPTILFVCLFVCFYTRSPGAGIMYNLINAFKVTKQLGKTHQRAKAKVQKLQVQNVLSS